MCVYIYIYIYIYIYVCVYLRHPPTACKARLDVSPAACGCWEGLLHVLEGLLHVLEK